MVEAATEVKKELPGIQEVDSESRQFLKSWLF
jgi:hypothetical protein